jgi:hypothetical protein
MDRTVLVQRCWCENVPLFIVQSWYLRFDGRCCLSRRMLFSGGVDEGRHEEAKTLLTLFLGEGPTIRSYFPGFVSRHKNINVFP